MSTTSIHRLKEKGAGGGKITAKSDATATATTKSFKTLTAVSAKSVPLGNGPHSLHKSSSGKENPQRPVSRPRASSVTRPKPTMQSMPRMDKQSAMRVGENGAASEARARYSTSSFVPRGRSSSPSEFSRVLSDMEKCSSRVSLDRPNIGKRVMSNKVSVNRKTTGNGNRISEKSDNNGTFIHVVKSVENKKFSSRIVRNADGNSVCSSSIEMHLNDRIYYGDKGQVLEESANMSGMKNSRLNGDADLRDKNWSSDSTKLKSSRDSMLDGNVKLSELSGTFPETEMDLSVGKIVQSLGSTDLNGNSNVDLSEKDHVFEEVHVKTSGEKCGKLISKGLRVVGRSSVSSGALKDKTVIEEGKGSTFSAKRYPSKLHEKLAFLEGKVKKIASDIKQTKEMLDLNNPDASKVILSDIQEKISGIEKAMGNVVSTGNTNIELLKDDKIDEGKVKESTEQEERQVCDGKRSVKELSVQELEVRLCPHHKLLKDRTCLKPSSEIVDESTRNQIPQDKSRSLIDENSIALEFLEALKTVQSVPAEDKNEDTENSEDAAPENNSASLIACQNNFDLLLTTNEKLDEFDEQENTSRMVIDEENEKSCVYMLKEIGHKISTGGWFVSEGEAVLLSHDDGSCSYYDITNCEGKAEYKPPVGISQNMWQDCWIVRAPSADGCSGRYVVAASAGNSFEAGFCSWDFYAKDVRAFHVESGTANVRTALSDLPNNTLHRRNGLSSTSSPEHQQWFYRPCGPLIVSAASCQRSVKVYDIRDGEHVMRWELQKPVATMEYSNPLQWRNKGKVVVAEADTISLWDVSSLSAQPLLSISSCNRKVSALHVNNTDAELGGGVRQRASSSEVEGNDGVFCTADSINVLDFRQPSGIGLKIPKVGVDVQSAYSRGDSVLLGCASLKSAGKKQFSSQIQQFSLRKQRLVSTYVLPDSNAHSHHKAITQVWGSSNLVMGVCGLGLYVYDSSKDEGLLPYTMDSVQKNDVKYVVGPDDLYYPSFDYLASRVLLISRDRPALWRYVS